LGPIKIGVVHRTEQKTEISFHLKQTIFQLSVKNSLLILPGSQSGGRLGDDKGPCPSGPDGMTTHPPAAVNRKCGGALF
jgi:hypothetical protein